MTWTRLTMEAPIRREGKLIFICSLPEAHLFTLNYLHTRSWSVNLT